MALIPPFFLDCVVSVGVQSTLFNQGTFTTQMNWIGTGFLVGRLIEGTAGIQIISATLMDEWREVANC